MGGYAGFKLGYKTALGTYTLGNLLSVGLRLSGSFAGL